tara:strand:+ start:1043 stop:1285 length:243 start_codon:yes stop_codon:yes gene_type:complete
MLDVAAKCWFGGIARQQWLSRECPQKAETDEPGCSGRGAVIRGAGIKARNVQKESFCIARAVSNRVGVRPVPSCHSFFWI